MAPVRMNVYVFLHRRPIDLEPSPGVLTDLNSAVDYPHRVSDGVIVSLQEFGTRSARAIADDIVADVEAARKAFDP